MSFLSFWEGFKWFIIVVIPFVLLAILVEIIRSIPYWILSQRAKAAGVDKVDSMSGEMFEKWLVHLFSKAGYSVKRTPYQGDHGADLILTAKDGTRIAVQAKKFTSRKDKVGAKAIGEALRGKEYYKCDQAMMVTNQGYTQQAIHEAQRIGVKLMDRKELIEFVEKTNIKKKKMRLI